MLLYTGSVADALAADLSDMGPHISDCVKRHYRGDWGDMPPEDKALNDASVKAGAGVMHSAFKHPTYPEIWIITDADHTSTTVMFPSDY